MNRRQRRALKATVVTHPTPDSIVLRGGPMDGWVVKPDAPALQRDWWHTWPLSIRARFAPGRYAPPVAAGGSRTSAWVTG